MGTGTGQQISPQVGHVLYFEPMCNFACSHCDGKLQCAHRPAMGSSGMAPVSAEGRAKKRSSYSELVRAAGNFESLQELAGASAQRPAEEENAMIERVESMLHARFCTAPAFPHIATTTSKSAAVQNDAPSRDDHGNGAVSKLPDRKFLQTCLRVWQYRIDDAGKLGFWVC